MLRAIRSIALAALAAALFAAPALAQQPSNTVDGIGLVDYSRKPTFKVGTYVQYHMTGHSSKGHSQDYKLVVGVAGEERFWGDPGFWVETITQGNTVSADEGGAAVASLMSYSVFRDSIPTQHLQYYVRKTINDTDDRGNPHEVIAKGRSAGIKSHTKVDPNTHWYSDTLASDSVSALGRMFWCKRLHTRRDVTNTVDKGDSTIMTEYREDRDTYLTTQIPLTSVVREDIDYLETRKAWLAGRSEDAQTTVNTHSVGQAMLLGYGFDYAAQMIVDSKRKSIREQDREAGIKTAPASATPKKSSKSSAAKKTG